MATDKRKMCSSELRSGKRCRYKAQIGDLCGIHYRGAIKKQKSMKAAVAKLEQAELAKSTGN